MAPRFWAYLLDVALARLPTNYEASDMVSLAACRYDDPDETSMEYKVSSFFASAAR